MADSRSASFQCAYFGPTAFPSAFRASVFPFAPDIPLLPDSSKAEKDISTLRFTLEGNSPGIPPVSLPAGTRNESSEELPLEMPDIRPAALKGGLKEPRLLPAIPANHID
ncbi:MAG TPA: hypothetical protein VFU55_03685 [Terracidiphilus sp.]|nr:hypothetical protein [Terracidiphilus sp.]